jgi:hypothetical protein
LKILTKGILKTQSQRNIFKSNFQVIHKDPSLSTIQGRDDESFHPDQIKRNFGTPGSVEIELRTFTDQIKPDDEVSNTGSKRVAIQFELPMPTIEGERSSWSEVPPQKTVRIERSSPQTRRKRLSKFAIKNSGGNSVGNSLSVQEGNTNRISKGMLSDAVRIEENMYQFDSGHKVSVRRESEQSPTFIENREYEDDFNEVPETPNFDTAAKISTNSSEKISISEVQGR